MHNLHNLLLRHCCSATNYDQARCKQTFLFPLFRMST